MDVAQPPLDTRMLWCMQHGPNSLCVIIISSLMWFPASANLLQRDWFIGGLTGCTVIECEIRRVCQFQPGHMLPNGFVGLRLTTIELQRKEKTAPECLQPSWETEINQTWERLGWWWSHIKKYDVNKTCGMWAVLAIVLYNMHFHAQWQK